MPDVLGLHAASLDDPSQYQPAVDIFTERAHAWDMMHAETQKMPGGFIK